MARVNRQWVLRQRPKGLIQPGDLELVEAPVPALNESQVLVRTVYLSLDPTNRTWMNDAEGYLPPVGLGEVMRGLTLGVVEESRSDRFKAGDVVTPLSGTYAGIGQQVKWGLDLAARQINAAGGVAGRPLELIYEDEEANPAVAVQKAEKLFQVNKVDFLTGTVNSGSTLAVGQLAERNGRLIATTVSFADSITGDKCSPNVFRVNARAGMQSAALADWVAGTKPNANVFYLGPDYEMGRSTVAAFKSAAEAKGSKSVGEVFAPLDNKDGFWSEWSDATFANCESGMAMAVTATVWLTKI